VTAQPDLVEEQAFLHRAYEGLEAMRQEANRMLESVLDLGRGGTFQSRTERDIVVRTSLARLAQLDIGDQALCFGRIDRIPDEPGEPGESFHIGRIAVSDEDLEPLVVDWRAPVAEPFYRATGLDPQGLARRRHLAVRHRQVTGVEDEYFTRPAGTGPAGNGSGPLSTETAEDAGDHSARGEELVVDGMALGGPGALLAALGEARTGHMGDIVATIQREQDEIIRAPLAGALFVQGGPGTGKTAVALHRAAYLLYTHRFPLERQGVLVVGPNPLFLRYIEQVLPSLGETGVTLSTVAGLVPEIRTRAGEPVAVARLKGEARMARFLARAVRTRQRPLRRDAAVPFGAATLRLTAADTAEIVRLARRRPGTHNSRRTFVEQQVLRRLSEQYERFRRGVSRPTPQARLATPTRSRGEDAHDADSFREPLAEIIRIDGADIDRADIDRTDIDRTDIDRTDIDRTDIDRTDIDRTDIDPTDNAANTADAHIAETEDHLLADGVDDLPTAEIVSRLRREPRVREILHRIWPRLAPHELVHDLLGARPLLAAAGKGILSPAEQAMLHRSRSASLDDVPWTPADAALVDEARTLLGPRRSRSARARAEARERADRSRSRTSRDIEEIGFWPAGLDQIPRVAHNGHGSALDDDFVRSYGHIVVDEAQDLSPMQLRMLARRSISGSMTVVGDIAQATGPWAPGSWDEVAAHLTPNRVPRTVELTVSYRTPAEVVDVAARVLAAAAPGLKPPRPVRRSGIAPVVVEARDDLYLRVADAAAAQVALTGEGRTAVLVPGALQREVTVALAARGLQPVDPRDPAGEGLGAPLVVLPADAANGLEFDSVVVVEPALVASDAETPTAAGPGPVPGGGAPAPTRRGLRTLYVALTRPTKRLAVVWSLPPPVDLSAGGAAGTADAPAGRPLNGQDPARRAAPSDTPAD